MTTLERFAIYRYRGRSLNLTAVLRKDINPIDRFAIGEIRDLENSRSSAAASGVGIGYFGEIRLSDPVYLMGEKPVAPSAIAAGGHVSMLRPQKSYEVPRALDTDEISGIVDDFRKAAENAKRAGFDGIELHAANGYLFDQFLHAGSNTRNDRYGGPLVNRARFLLETVDILLKVWPAN